MSCLASNNYGNTTENQNAERIAINACRAEIVTCMSVNGDLIEKPKPDDIENWVNGLLGKVGPDDQEEEEEDEEEDEE